MAPTPRRISRSHDMALPAPTDHPSPGELAELLETVPRGVAVFTRHGRLVLANRCARHLKRMAARTFAASGDPWPDLVATAVGRLRQAPRGAVARAHFTIPPDRLLYAEGVATPRHDVLVVVWHEPLSARTSHRLLQEHAGLTGPEARLAIRVVGGASYRELATAFDLAEGTVRSRLSRLYARLGVSNQTALRTLLEEVLAACPLSQPPSHEEPTAAGPRTAAALTAIEPAEALHVVESLPLGLAVLDPAGRLRWCNAPAAQALGLEALGQHGEATRLLAEPPAAGAGHRVVALAGSLPALGVVWSLANGSTGAVVRRRRLQATPELCAAFVELGLAPQQARIAAHAACGATNAQIAAALDLSRGTVASWTSAIYEKLRVRGRVELAALALRLGARA